VDKAAHPLKLLINHVDTLSLYPPYMKFKKVELIVKFELVSLILNSPSGKIAHSTWKTILGISVGVGLILFITGRWIRYRFIHPT